VSNATKPTSQSPNITKLGIGSYGPIRSVNLEDRESQATVLPRGQKPKSETRKVKNRYGLIWSNSPHAALQDLAVFDAAASEADSLGCKIEIRVHSDVSCGAIAESLDRQNDKGSRRSDVIWFGHVAEGVGASWAIDGRPWSGSMHSEVGFTLSQLVSDDYFGWELMDKAGKARGVFLEHLIEHDAIFARTGCKSIQELSSFCAGHPDHPELGFIAEYISQMCQLATVVVSPARIVLFGPVFEADKEMIAKVRKAFVEWLRGEDMRRPVHFDELQNVTNFIDAPKSTNPMLRGALLLSALPMELLMRQGWQSDWVKTAESPKTGK
jgi:predicted NBD/HSP70 family sugar kinase